MSCIEYCTYKVCLTAWKWFVFHVLRALNLTCTSSWYSSMFCPSHDYTNLCQMYGSSISLRFPSKICFWSFIHCYFYMLLNCIDIYIFVCFIHLFSICYRPLNHRTCEFPWCTIINFFILQQCSMWGLITPDIT